jgi:hypothetical protein
MGYEAQWHKFPDELPQNDGPYITCDIEGQYSINIFRHHFVSRKGEELNDVFVLGKGNSRQSSIRTTVYFWVELPVLPPEVDYTYFEIAKLQKKIDKLQESIKGYKGKQTALQERGADD